MQMTDNKRITLSFGLMLTAIMSLLSCNPDCRDVKIMKAEWVTSYKDYYVENDTIIDVCRDVDTIVSYSIVSHKTRTEVNRSPSGSVTNQYTIHDITIHNNNNQYSNRFSIKLTGKEYLEASRSWKDISIMTNYINIRPLESYTFSIKHSSLWSQPEGYSEADATIVILQKPTRVSVKTMERRTVRQKKVKRIDSLIISDTIVNNCQCDIEALCERYKTIKELFESLHNQNLIFTE